MLILRDINTSILIAAIFTLANDYILRKLSISLWMDKERCGIHKTNYYSCIKNDQDMDDPWGK